jgi:predicted GNAT family acetyltransferase
LKVVALDERIEDAFWKHVNREPLDYYFFIYDWKLNRDKTKILLAMEDGKIEGLMLVYRDSVVQLRGKREAVKLLLDQLRLEKPELQAPLDSEDLILKKYPPKIRQEMMLMFLRKGEENIQVTTTPTKLGLEDADEIAELMRRADPVWWSEIKAEWLKLRMVDSLLLGIKQNHRIVSFGMSRLTDFGSNISAIATHQQHRNRGYATSIVSALVQEILKTSTTALIHVISDNTPAVRAYSKVGFKPYKTYLSIRT